MIYLSVLPRALNNPPFMYYVELTTAFFSTPHVVESGHPSVLIQAHLMQHSTRLPHPLASTPVLDICILKNKQGPPEVNAAIGCDNLAIVTSTAYFWEGDLSVWNWKTGVKIGDVHVPEPRLGLFSSGKTYFLTEIKPTCLWIFIASR